MRCIRGYSMKWLVPLLALVVGPALATAPPHYSVRVDLDPVRQEAAVEADLRITGRDAVGLHLPAGWEIEGLWRDEEPLPPPSAARPFRITGLDPSGSTIALRYRGRLPNADEATGEWGPFLGESGAFLNRGGGWYPEVSGAALMTHDIEIHVPDGWRAVASGEWIGGSEDSRTALFRHSRPGRGMTVVAGPWRVDERQLESGLRVRTYLTPGTAHLADTYLERTAEYLQSYHDSIGDAPFSTFAVVAAPIPVGVAFPGFTWIGESVLRLPFIPYTSLPHEVLHNWWGATVHVDYRDGNWSEGLTTWMADHRLAEQRDPEEARRMRGDWLRGHHALPAEDDYPLRRFRGGREGAHRVVGYQRGAMLFHMLRERLGEEAFDAGIRRFWAERAFQITRWAHLQEAFEAISGDDLAVHFDQWLHRTGAPRLQLEQAERTADGVTVRLSQSTPPYELHIPVVVETGDGSKRFTVFMDGTDAEAKLTTPGTPTALAVDPNYDLYRALDAGERIPVIREVVEAVAVHAAGPLAGEAVRMLQMESAVVDKGRADVVLVAAERAALGDLLDAAGAEATPLAPPDTRAAVWASRDGRGRPLLVITGDDREAIRGVLARLVRHARESYVAWDGERVTDSGLWPEPEEHGLRKAW